MWQRHSQKSLPQLEKIGKSMILYIFFQCYGLYFVTVIFRRIIFLMELKKRLQNSTCIWSRHFSCEDVPLCMALTIL